MGKCSRPVGGCGQAHTVGTVPEREHLGAVNPANGCPRETVDTDEDVRHGNDTLGGRTVDGPRQVIHAGLVLDRVAVHGHHAGGGEVDDCADDGAAKKKLAASDAVDEGEDATGGDEEDDVLDDGRGEGGVTLHTRHAEDVGEVVELHIPSEQLLPDLDTAPSERALPESRTKESEDANVRSLVGNASSVLDLLQLGKNDRVIVVTLAVQIGQDFMDLLPAIAVREPAGRLGEEQEGDEENGAGGGLDTPRNAEGGGAVDGHGAAVGD